MLLVLVTVVLALVVGRAAGGRLDRLGTLRLRSAGLAVAAAAVQLATAVAPHALYLAGLALSAVIVAVFLVRNRRVAGLPLVTLGLALNAVVVLLNDGMPVSLYAAARAGAPVESIAAGTDPRHVIADGATPLGLLGDVIPVPLPGHPEVASAGDVLVAAGLGLLVVSGMRPGRRLAASR